MTIRRVPKEELAVIRKASIVVAHAHSPRCRATRAGAIDESHGKACRALADAINHLAVQAAARGVYQP